MIYTVKVEKEMVTHSSIPARKIPWMEKPGRLQSMGSQRVRHNWATSLTHTVKDFNIVVETEIGVFLEFPCFPYVPGNVGNNLISASSSFSKPSLDIWKFLVNIMLKPSMQDFSMTLPAWEMSAIVWWLAHSLVLPVLGITMRIDLFQSCGHCWVFQICWHSECKTLMASSFKGFE